MTMNAAAANEARYNAGISNDYSIAEFYNDEYTDVVEVEEDETAERQRINAEMARWFGM
jgi:hypothetical protein